VRPENVDEKSGGDLLKKPAGRMIGVQGFGPRSLGTVQVISSEQTTEEDLPMLRLRLASLALACGFLLALSGCRSPCDDGGPFRLFRSNYEGGGLFGGRHRGGGGDCPCSNGQTPPFMDAAHSGPILTTPTVSNGNVPIPITNIPSSQPPNIFKVPATPTPYHPPGH
jgi:hypothetical protein